jgi:hypothetical protein
LTSVQYPNEPNAKQPVHDMESNSFFANVTALGENGALMERLVRSTDEELAPYIARSKAHAMEIEKLLPKMSSKELHSDVIGKALYGIEKLQVVLKVRASLQSATTFLSGILDRIQPTLKHANR